MFCRGGEQDLDNLQLLCTACHKLETTRELGREALERKVRERVGARYGLYYARGHYLPPIAGGRRSCRFHDQRLEPWAC
jgi:hypothetical protein